MAAFPGLRPLIEPAKLTDYLLSFGHPKGRSKARYFAAAGYRADHWMRLRDDLLTAIESAPPTAGITDAHGVKYRVPVQFTGANGRLVRVVSVWIARSADSPPRLVTAYPRRTP